MGADLSAQWGLRPALKIIISKSQRNHIKNDRERDVCVI